MVYFIPVLVVVTTAMAIRIITKSWLSPGAFFALFWSFFMVVPMFFAAEFKVDAFGLWYIAIFSMACGAGSVIAYGFPVTNYLTPPPAGKTIGKRLLMPFNSLMVINLMGLVLFIFYAVSNYGLNFDNTSLLTIPNLIALDRYAGDINYPAHIKYSLYCVYPAALLGGFIFILGNPSRKLKLITILPLIAAVLKGILEASRSGILLALVLFFSALFAGLITNKNEWGKKISLRVILSGSTALAIFMGFFIVIQWLRQGMNPLAQELIIERIRAYLFGYLAAFTQWVGHFDSVLPTFGLTTFAGPANLVKIMERPLGFYTSVSIAPGVSTNIFSAFRGLIIDYSLIGSIIIAFISGFLFQLTYNRIQSGSFPAMVFLSIFFAFTLYSPLISIFHYNSIMAAWVVLYLFIFFSKFSRSKNRLI